MDRCRNHRMNITDDVQLFTIDSFKKLLITNAFIIMEKYQSLPFWDLLTFLFVSDFCDFIYIVKYYDEYLYLKII